MSDIHAIHRAGVDRPSHTSNAKQSSLTPGTGECHEHPDGNTDRYQQREGGGDQNRTARERIKGKKWIEGSNRSNRIGEVEPVLYMSRFSVLDSRQLVTLMRMFLNVHVAAPFACPEVLRGKVNWYHYGQEECRADIWNHMLMHSGSGWTLFLQDDERVDTADLAAMAGSPREQWPPALVQWSENGTKRQCYQMRLVPSDAGKPFDGIDLPDCTRYMQSKGIHLADRPIIIQRDADPFEHLDVEKELSTPRPAAQLHLVTGLRLFESREYVHASAQFRRVMKNTHVFLHDKVAAFNGLASCMAEQHKWTRAVELAEESIHLQPVQQLPYLILFRVHQLGKRWGEAHDMLSACLAEKGKLSGASFDRKLPEQELLALMADMAFRAGRRKESFTHYRCLYEMQNGSAPPELTERLLLLALEEGEYDLSVRYFRELFGEPDAWDMDEAREMAIFDYLGLFMQNGWYEFASTCYERLIQQQPANEFYMRRWIVALSKSRDIEKARSLLAGICTGRKRKAASG